MKTRNRKAFPLSYTAYFFTVAFCFCAGYLQTNSCVYTRVFVTGKPTYRGIFHRKMRRKAAHYGRAKALHAIKQIPKARQLLVTDKEIRDEPYERTADPEAGNEKRKQNEKKQEEKRTVAVNKHMVHPPTVSVVEHVEQHGRDLHLLGGRRTRLSGTTPERTAQAGAQETAREGWGQQNGPSRYCCSPLLERNFGIVAKPFQLPRRGFRSLAP